MGVSFILCNKIDQQLRRVSHCAMQKRQNLSFAISVILKNDLRVDTQGKDHY